MRKKKARSAKLEMAIRPVENPQLQNVIGAGVLTIPNGYQADDDPPADSPPEGNP